MFLLAVGTVLWVICTAFDYEITDDEGDQCRT